MRPMPRRLLAYLVTVCAALAMLAPASAAEWSSRPAYASGWSRPAISGRASIFPASKTSTANPAITILDLPASAYAELERAANAKEQHGLDRPEAGKLFIP